MWNYRMNYRIGVKKVPVPSILKMIKEYKEGYKLVFFVFSCYYNKEGIPNGYPKNAESISILSDWEELEDLQGTYKLIEEAFKKPIIDLDNFPNEYKREQTTKNT